MSEQSNPEPTMEEILASIRRIISEDEAPAGGEERAARDGDAPAAAAAVAHESPAALDEPTPAAGPPGEGDDEDALELTDKVESHGDLDIYSPAPEPQAEPAVAPPPLAEGLVSEPAAAAAAAAFHKLSASIGMPRDNRTLEDVVREMLRPLLQTWLDENLPSIVQAAVEAEVERIARGRVR